MGCAISWYQKFSLNTSVHQSILKVPATSAASVWPATAADTYDRTNGPFSSSRHCHFFSLLNDIDIFPLELCRMCQFFLAGLLLTHYLDYDVSWRPCSSDMETCIKTVQWHTKYHMRVPMLLCSQGQYIYKFPQQRRQPACPHSSSQRPVAQAPSRPRDPQRWR